MNYIWEKQVGEAAKDYKYFCIYRDMPYTDNIDRTLAKTAEIVNKSLRRIEIASAKNDWVKRSEAYDEYLEKITRERFQNELLEMRERHSNIAQNLTKKALEALSKIDTEKIRAGDITTMLKTAIDIERLSRGEATEIKNINNKVEGIVSVYLPDNNRG